MLTTRKMQRRITLLYGPKYAAPLKKIHSRVGDYLYVVKLREHPDKVKIGMTKKWSSRSNSYRNWNLARGDGILESAVFAITEDFVDLAALEKAILERCDLEPAYGREWFFGEIEQAARLIDDSLNEFGLTYVLV